MSDVKPGLREVYAGLTRNALLEAAANLFVADGFDDTSVDDIARRAQISKGAVYHHFSDKREIFAEVFRLAQSEVMQAAAASLSGSDTTDWDGLQQATHVFLTRYVADDRAASLLRQAIHVLGWERVRSIDSETAIPMILALLRQAIEAGKISHIPLDAAAEAIFGLYCHSVLLIADRDRPVKVDDVEAVVLTLLGGLTARSAQ